VRIDAAREAEGSIANISASASSGSGDSKTINEHY
jgi:hypothetical protein